MRKPIFLDVEALEEYFDKRKVDLGGNALEELNLTLDAAVERIIRQQKNRARIVKNDYLKKQMPATKVLSTSQLASLPSWVAGEIEKAQVVGSSKQVVQIPDGRKYHLGNPLNELSGGEWTFFLNSVLSTRYPTSGPESFAHTTRKIHPSPKPPQLMREIIQFFTKEGELVFDYFMGVGGTLLGASLCNRRAIGVDLSSEYIDVYKTANRELGLTEQVTIEGDSISLLKNPSQLEKQLNGDKFSLVAIDPPYGDMMSRSKTGEAAKKKKDSSSTPFTDLGEDLGNFDLEDFFPVLAESVANALPFLKNKGHVVVFIKDLQPDGSNTNLLHAKVIETLNALDGLQYLGTKIWADQSVNLYPYGYPYAFVANQIHQYIMIFRK